MFRWLFRRCRPAVTPVRNTRTLYRPHLEELESRVVPATTAAIVSLQAAAAKMPAIMRMQAAAKTPGAVSQEGVNTKRVLDIKTSGSDWMVQFSARHRDGKDYLSIYGSWSGDPLRMSWKEFESSQFDAVHITNNTKGRGNVIMIDSTLPDRPVSVLDPDPGTSGHQFNAVIVGAPGPDGLTGIKSEVFVDARDTVLSVADFQTGVPRKVILTDREAPGGSMGKIEVSTPGSPDRVTISFRDAKTNHVWLDTGTADADVLVQDTRVPLILHAAPGAGAKSNVMVGKDGQIASIKAKVTIMNAIPSTQVTHVIIDDSKGPSGSVVTLDAAGDYGRAHVEGMTDIQYTYPSTRELTLKTRADTGAINSTFVLTHLLASLPLPGETLPVEMETHLTLQMGKGDVLFSVIDLPVTLPGPARVRHTLTDPPFDANCWSLSGLNGGTFTGPGLAVDILFSDPDRNPLAESTGFSTWAPTGTEEPLTKFGVEDFDLHEGLRQGRSLLAAMS
jgi:hypothetical protein